MSAAPPLPFLCGYYIMILIFLYITLYIKIRRRTILLRKSEEVRYEIWLL